MSVIKRLVILSIFFVFIGGNTFSQPGKTFTRDPQIFVNELTKMFETTQSTEQKDAGKKLMQEFSDLWLNGKIKKPMQDSIYKMCNIMLSRKMKTYPNFESYLDAAIRFHKSSQTEESFGAWCIALRKLAAMSNQIRFMALLEATNNLLTNNTLAQTQIMLWKSSNNHFTFKFDSIPLVEFGEGNLTCIKKNDSTIIYETKGIFYPTLNKWKGSGGKILWTRAGFDPTKVYAEIFKYSLSTQKSEFDMDTVRFYNYNFFDKPLLGSLQEKVLVDVGEDRVSYPRFVSFNKLLEIKDIFKDIDYKGGFAMYGPKLMGMGDNQTKATLTFKRENKIFVKLAAKIFIIKKNNISSDRSSASIYWKEDSIHHPGLKIRYNDTIKELSLMREKVGTEESPFFDTYHKIDIYVEAIYWKMGEPKMDLQMLKGSNSESAAEFESDNYYSEFRFDKLRGMEDIHPLYILRDIAAAKGKTFTVTDVQNKMHVAKEQIIDMMITYANGGFILFDIESGLITIKDRVYHYLNSKNRKTDYDVIQFKSLISNLSNGTLNLLNFDLNLRGVSRIFLSDSQNVYVMPDQQELTLKKNRDFICAGQIHAGLFDFYGKNFNFSYDKFTLDLPNLDSLNFKVQDYSQPADNFGVHPFVRVRSAIENLVGEIQIDDPGNKSGKLPFPKYPIFTSKKDSYVYYDKSFIFNGVYSRDRFYYRVYPFTIDTLDSYHSERKQFNGYLVSAGIFPDIIEPLRVQPDFSLGFVLRTPEPGYPAYGGKGTYDSIVDLSYQGFKGRGTLKYLTSTTKSNDILFFPDSMIANAQLYTIKEKTNSTEYPAVVARDVKVRWYPYLDSMHVTQNSIPLPFSMFGNQSVLKGSLTLQPKGLTGAGTMSFSKVEMTSKLYEFKHHVFTSDTTEVLFKTTDLSKLVIRTQNFNVKIDFEKKLGKFVSNDKTSKISFPFNQYACYLYNFDWFMEKDELLLKSANLDKFQGLKTMKKEDLIDQNLSESGFVSEHPAQDSLRFYAPLAKYNLNENIIYCTEVPIIKVADAAIFPDSGNVTILRNAEIRLLENAKLIANTVSRKHMIYDCKINIETQKKYSGQGNYDYIDETDRKQKIFFTNIYVDSLKTRANGDIAEATNFTLSPDFKFWGKVRLTAEKELLNFNGGTRIKHNCDTLKEPWLKFATDIDPKNILIPVSNNPREYTKEGSSGPELGTGLYAGDDTTLVYSAFLQHKVKSNDEPVLTAGGFLSFDNAKQTYIIMPQIDSSAKYLPPYDMSALNRNKCITSGEGTINIGNNLGRMKMKTFGTIKHTMIDKITEMDVVMTIDFPFDDAAMTTLTKEIEAESAAEAVNTDDDNYNLAIKCLMGPDKAPNLLTQLSISPRLKDLPDELVHTFFLSDVKLKWNTKTRSFVSQGNLGFVSMGKTQMYRYLKGNLEISRKRSGIIVNLYLELANSWYFFSYQSNRMSAISSKKGFTDAIKSAMTDNKNQFDAKDKEPAYQYVLGNSKRKNDFLIKIGVKQNEEENKE